jgi:hypothetical protein
VPRRVDLEGSQRHTAGWEFVHIAIDDCTRLAYAEVSRRREGDDSGRLPAPRASVLPPSRHRDQGAAHGQWRCLHLDRSRRRMPGTRHPSPADTATPAPDQRQGRALHPHDARRLGLRSDLPRQRRAHSGP